MCSAVLGASCTGAFCNAWGALQCLQLHYGPSLNTPHVLRCSGHPVLGHLPMLSVTCNTQSLTVGHLVTLRASCNAQCLAVLRTSCTRASCSAWDTLQCSCLQECPFGVGRQGWARCWLEACMQVPRWAWCAGQSGQMFPRCYTHFLSGSSTFGFLCTCLFWTTNKIKRVFITPLPGGCKFRM